MTPPRVALEITPPREPRSEVLLRRARLLGAAASAVHVIHRPDRLTSLDASIALEQEGIHAVWHVTNRGRSGAEIETEIARAARAGLRSALVVRGESGPPDCDDTPKLRAIVSRIRSELPRARIGVTLDPYGDAERALAILWPKLDAGASFIQTQPVFSASVLRGVTERVRARAPGVSIVPMVIPILSAPAAEKLAQRLRIPLPESLTSRLSRGEGREAWAVFTETLLALQASGLADGVAVMTQEMDPSPPFGAEVLRSLQESGWLDPAAS